jgi:uncharacterized protein (TIGR02996 family)
VAIFQGRLSKMMLGEIQLYPPPPWREHPEFLHSILTDPADDAARLVYADWLEEQGSPEKAARARLIRLGYERRDQLAGRYRASPENDARQAALDDAILALVEEYGRRWFSIPPFLTLDSAGAKDWKVVRESVRDQLDRGFVGRAVCEAESFLSEAGPPSGPAVSFAGALFSRQPVTNVLLSDRGPARVGSLPRSEPVVYRWWRIRDGFLLPDADDLPARLWDLLSSPQEIHDYPDGQKSAWYTTAAEAVADLSRACVRYGRRAAGLGELP